MYPGYPADNPASFYTQDVVEISMAAHGGSIVEVARGDDGKWSIVRDSEYNRRLTPLSTAMTFSGPAAGHPRLQTNEDPTGLHVMGTFNNCAGGITPWGTWLMSEENINFYFMGENADADEAVDHGAWAFPVAAPIPGATSTSVSTFHANPANRTASAGWWSRSLDPASTPVKRTALGRFKHEGCENTLTKDSRLVVYMGDDQAFEYLYKFVSAAEVSADRAANASLLDEGTLYVARFEEDGSGRWMPLVHGENGIDEASGFFFAGRRRDRGAPRRRHSRRNAARPPRRRDAQRCDRESICGSH